ncbi:hypothetical protein, partial [Streptomyces fimbriatus]|uniref:hypothetical protein n=1 Tax=Streptomyces fimbriatus TaxID=68197 RepID=UPI0031D44308
APGASAKVRGPLRSAAGVGDAGSQTCPLGEAGGGPASSPRQPLAAGITSTATAVRPLSPQTHTA